MVKGLAYLILGLVMLGLTALYLLGERSKLLATVDRRLAAMIPAGTEAAVRAAQPISLPDLLVPLLARAQIEATGKRVHGLIWSLIALSLITLVLAGPIATLAVLLGLPAAALGWLRHRAQTRTDALIEALPHYIDAVRQLQAVGNSLSQAIERALADAPDIVKSYFAPAARRLEMGAPVGETIQQLADLLRIPEVSMLAAAIRTNLRFGGSISSVLRNLSHILRERVRVKWELKAATSEAKVSSRVLIFMPLLAMGVLVAMNPSYILFFVDDPRGQTQILYAVGLEAMGILVMRRIMRLDF